MKYFPALISALLLSVTLSAFGSTTGNVAPSVVRDITSINLANGASVDFNAGWGLAGCTADPEHNPSWASSTMPAGLSIDASTGRVTGTVGTDVTLNIIFSCDNDLGPSAADSFTAIVGAGSTPPAAQAIDGWTTVTTALDATGTGQRIDIGGGNMDHADLSTFDPDILTPGTVVNIYYKATPYNYRLLFTEDGTAANPIIINGVTDAAGQRPEIDCADAQTNFENRWSTFVGGADANLACWYVGRRQDTGVSNDAAQYIEFRNLEMYGAHPDNTAEFNNVDLAYFNGASPLRLQHGQYITISGSEFRNNGNGFNSGDLETNACVVLRGNLFEQNGIAGQFLEHQIYFQAVGLTPFCNIIEGNFVGEPAPGAMGGAIKVRGSDHLIRYNTIIGSQRAFDVVAAQGVFPNYIYDNFSAQEILDRYRTAYIYGNQLVIDYDTGGYFVGGIFHASGDTSSSGNNGDDQTWQTGSSAGNVMWRGVGSPVYFYHNSIYVRTFQFRQYLFDFDLASAGTNDYTSEGVSANNVFHWERSAAPGVSNIGFAIDTGSVTFEGVNHFHFDGISAGSPFEGRNEIDGLGDDPDITVVGDSAPTLVTAPGDPLFTNPDTGALETRDLSLGAGSPAAGVAPVLTGPMANFPVLLQPVLPGAGGGAVVRSATTNLGAFE